MYTTEQKAYIWLSLTPKMTPVRRRRILEYADDLGALMESFAVRRGELEEPLGKEVCDLLAETIDKGLVEKEIAALDRMGAVALTPVDERYPDDLHDLAQPPVALYCQGDLTLLAGRNIAVVGTRNITRYGRDVTQNMVADLVTHGFCIVSGLARGVDTVAHRTALSYDKLTVGVLPCGLDKVYPAENRELFREIAEKGLLVSEYPLGTTVQQYTFVERNRIISALAMGVLVTEAGDKSGALITANHALEQAKDVFAVPGNIYSKASVGTNNLLKSMQGALVTTAYDILEYYHVAVDRGAPCDIQLDMVEAQIVDAVEEGDRHVEELMALTQMTVSELTPILTKLELMGLVKKLGGNYYGK